MKKSEFTSAVRKLADDAGLRHISPRNKTGDTWVGVYSGILVVMNLDSVRLYMELASPEQESERDAPPPGDPEEDAAAEQGEPEEEADAFRRASEAGLPSDWFQQNPGEPWGFQLVIDQQRRRELAPEALDGILDRIAEDLHDLGAEDSQPCCECENQATTLGYFDTPEGPVMAPYCDQCWNATQLETQGAIRVNRPTQLLLGWALLLAGTVVFAVIWGYSQHPDLEVPFLFQFVGCTAAGIGLGMATSWVAQGSSLGLRVGVATCMIAATLTGNIMGVKFVLEAEGVQISWSELVPLYFVWYFPTHIGQELMFLSGGVVGVLIAFFLMRQSEHIRLR